MVLEKYEEVAGFNMEGYYIRHYGKLDMVEFVPTMETIGELSEKGDYLGVYFVLDNIGMKIWVYQDESIKTKKYVKALKNEKDEGKLFLKTAKIFEQENNYSIDSYEIRRALDYESAFMDLFKYQLNEFPLYKQHYLLPQYEAIAGEKVAIEKAKAEASAITKTCVNCGWMISTNLSVCPKCHRNPRKKFTPED